MALAQQLTGGFGSSGEFGPRNREIDLPPPADEPSLLTLTIELRGSKPRIWRRLSLPGDLTLDVVHTLFQAAMGWTDSHLHRFQPGDAHGYDEPFFVTEEHARAAGWSTGSPEWLRRLRPGRRPHRGGGATAGIPARRLRGTAGA
jgi:Plasmid pRiA4b ORF-3-like protein